MEKVNPIKYSIDYIINLKCKNCQDKTFCKLRTYYEKLEKPTITDLEKLTKCLYYKKQEITKYKNKISLRS